MQAEALNEANLRQARLEDEMVKIENETRVEIGSAKRQLDELEDIVAEVRIAKQNAERKCETLTNEKEVINKLDSLIGIRIYFVTFLNSSTFPRFRPTVVQLDSAG